MSTNIVGLINITAPGANWIVNIILWLVGICGSIAGGIVLFTLFLKIITLPFDYFSRASMRKNSLKMEEMRPELEKLQKQYAGDKMLYNQKMMALYKKNGYSMFGACLPTILTLVIFIIAMTGFSAYSRYQNVKYFEDMSVAYNQVVYSGIEIDNEYIIKNEDGTIKLNSEELSKKALPITGEGVTVTNPDGTTSTTRQNTFVIDTFISSEVTHIINVVNKEVTVITPDDPETTDINEGKTVTSRYFEITTTNGFIMLKQHYKFGDNNEYIFENTEYSVTGDNLVGDNALKKPENNYLKNYDGKTFNESEQTPLEFVKDIQQTMSAYKFRESNTNFLWVKNIWAQDQATAHPVDPSASGFNNTNQSKINESEYNELIAKLTDEMNAPNGYYILVILTAAVSLLMQWVSTKSQKAQMELQSVDGNGMKQQKIMMWMMPIMMAVFSFLYTAAFSIYMILSSAISILTTLGINWIVDRKYKKKKAATEGGKGEVIRGRVYVDKTPKVDPKEEKKAKKEKKSKDKKDKNDSNKGDFISGGKHIRGRLK